MGHTTFRHNKHDPKSQKHSAKHEKHNKHAQKTQGLKASHKPMKTKPNTDEPATDAPIRFIRGCVLNSLTRSEQERLYDWLEMYPPKRVLELVQADAPEGFGIQTHLTTLRRFHARAHDHFQRQLMADTTEALANSDPSDEALESLTLRAVRRAALELSTTHHNSPTHFNVVARWLAKLKQIEQRDKEMAQRDCELKLAERRLELETKKFEFNAAREALCHLATLREIFLTDSMDDQDKMTAARKVMFGPAAAAAALAAEQSAIGAQGKGSETAPLQIVPFPLGNAQGMRQEAVPAQPIAPPLEAGDGLGTQAGPTQPVPLSLQPGEEAGAQGTAPQRGSLSLGEGEGVEAEGGDPRSETTRDNETPVSPFLSGARRPRGPEARARGMRPKNQSVPENAESKQPHRRGYP